MKNLRLIYNIENNVKVTQPKALVLDSNGNGSQIFICLEDSVILYDISKDSTETLYEIPQIVGVEHLAISNELCIASENGSVALFDLKTRTGDEVTFCEGGIEKVSWSPDQEVVVFVTKSKNVVVMTSTLDPILENSLDDYSSFGDREFITVGWGKKETQFHGSEGKQAAKQKSGFVPPENLDKLDQTITISWRGDSELFAVSYVGVNGRMFKVFSKEGKLQFTSEKLNDLGTSLAWKPSGSWIATPHRLPNKYTIGLFEKNGLRHREIILPFKYENETVVKMNWSSDSDILALHTKSSDDLNVNRLYFYTIGNYHWYLKQFLEFNENVEDFVWDLGMGGEEKLLYVLLSSGKLRKYKWTYEICHSFGNTDKNQSVVNVIDGSDLLITDFRNNIIPPPMCNAGLPNASEFIQFCGFLRNFPSKECGESRGNQFFTINSKKILSFYELQFSNKDNGRIMNQAQLLSSLKSEVEEINDELIHWIWLNQDQMIACKTENFQTKIFLLMIGNHSLNKLDEIIIPDCIGSMTNYKDQNLILHSINGNFYEIKINEEEFTKKFNVLFKLPEYCEHIEAATNPDVKETGAMKIIALKLNHNLYVNEERIASNVTSFCLTEKYLAFTQLSLLKFMKLTNNFICNERKIERGGKLIIIIPRDSKTILQMPRGNLEVINPRLLSLDIIGEYLNNGQYSKTMDLLRKQRINLNIIIDHRPDLFFENISKFLEEVGVNLHWLNLFLSDLQNEDFTRTMYSSNYTTDEKDRDDFTDREKFHPEGYTIETKINFVCERICKVMEEINYEHYLLPIITGYVKRNNIEKALEIIWNEKKKEKGNPEQSRKQNEFSETGDKKKTSARSEEALKYLLYLVDVNELYNIALGMYDFGLVLFVATKSQKDPKEFLPFLNELKSYEENYRKFKIDEHLKRYERALENICKCAGDEQKFEECLKFIERYELYQKGLKCFEGNDTVAEQYRKICLSFGDFLRNKGKHEDASILYERGGDLQQAILSARHVLDWRRCLYLTNIICKGNKEELQSITKSLVPALVDKGMLEDAFSILKMFGSNFSEALACLLKGHFYLKALFEARIFSPDLLASDVVPSLNEYKENLQLNIQADIDLFLKYKTRLLKIRAEKDRRQAANLLADDMNDCGDECDILSDTSSMKSSQFTNSSSNRTGKTFRSSKNRRKHERKLLSLKEGNPFEDIALIDALHNHVTKIQEEKHHVRDVCKALIEIRSDEDARKIQKLYAKLLKTVKDSLEEIWIPEISGANANGMFIGGGLPNVDYAQLQNEQRYSMISPQKRCKPLVNITDWEHDIIR